MKKEWKILTLMVCFISALNKKTKKKTKKNTLFIKKKKKNKEKQHTFGWEEKKMLELGWEGEKEEKIKKEKQVCERKRWRPNLSWFWYFILVFTNRITDEQLNINIFNIFVCDFVYKFKWKFSTYVKIFRKPFQILPMAFHFVVNSVMKKKWTVKKSLIITAWRSEQFSWSLKYTNGYILSVYLYVMNIVNSDRMKGHSSHGLWNISKDTFH